VETIVTVNDDDNADTVEPAFKRQTMKSMMTGPAETANPTAASAAAAATAADKTHAAAAADDGSNPEASASNGQRGDSGRSATSRDYGADVTGFGRVVDPSKLGKKYYAEHRPTTDKVCVYFQQGYFRQGSCPNIHQKSDGK